MLKTIRTFSILICLLIIPLSLAACNHSGEKDGDGTLVSTTQNGDTDSGDGAGVPTESPLPTAEPLEFELAEDFSVSLTMGDEGGSLEVEGPDGTLYQLELPPGALLTEQTITLTPITDITNLPLSGGLHAAVQILPEGLDLVLPAALTITPPSPFDPENAVPFGYNGVDHSLYLVPAARLGESFQTYLSHFSADGVGTGTPAEREQIVSQPAPSAADQYSSDASETLSDCFNQEGDLEPDQEAQDALTQHLMAWWKDGIQPALVFSGKSESIEVFTSAVNEYLAWKKQVSITASILSLDDEDYFADEIEEGWDLIKTAFENIRTATVRACTDDHDLRALNVLFRLERLADLLALPPVSVNEVYNSCLQFELVFEGTVTVTAPTLYSASMVVNTTLEMQHIEVEDWPMSLAAVGEDDRVIPAQESFAFIPEIKEGMEDLDCPLGISDFHNDPSMAGYWYAVLDLPWQEIEETGQPNDLALALWASGPELTGFADCDILPYYGVFFFDFFQVAYLEVTEPFYEFDEVVYRDWDVQGGEVYATKAFSGEVVGEGQLLATADFKMTLLHKPE